MPAIRAFLLALFVPGTALATTVGPQRELAITVQASQRAPAIAWDELENVYVLVYEDGRNAATTGTDLYAVRISADGTLMDTAGIGLLENSVLAGNQTQPAIVYNRSGAVHLIAWVSAHLGSPDVFVARFLAGSGSTIPSAGVLVTDGGTDAESTPAVGVSANQYLVAFQTISVAMPGISRINARRLQLDGVTFSDPAPFGVVGPTAGSTFETEAKILSVGSNFLVAWQDNRNGNVDLFARTIPDSGAVPASPGVTLYSAPLAQDSVALAPLGAGNFVAVWEDASNTTGDDVSGRRFAANLSPLGNAFAVSQAVNDQSDPKVAGDLSGALVVWQDRRNGVANGITYAARLDATGNVLDPSGFPVLAYNANSFEHTVAKGPNNDYLVASVRFDNTRPRIHYRIIRLEPPGGMMTATGPAMVPANGTATADLTFGPAAGASGFAVVDGTLYTVMLSQPGVQLLAPDASATIPGHQVESSGGQVFLQLRTTEHVLCDVMVTSVEGNSSGMASVQFLNVPPVATNVRIAPAPTARSSEDLTLSYAFSDVNGDPEMNTIIQWTRNAAVQGQIQGTTAPASFTVKGDTWQALVFPSDGLPLGTGTQVGSNVVTIGNSPPAAVNLRLRPPADLRTGTELGALYIYNDADGDTETGSELRWYDRGTERVDLFNQSTIPGAQVIKGQEWHFTVLPNDGSETGALATSPVLPVINTAPVASAGADGSVLERRPYQLDGTRSSDIDPQDGLTYLWTQVDNGRPRVELSSTSSPTPSFVAPSVAVNEPLLFDLVVSDGDEPSVADRVVITVMRVTDTDQDGLDDEEEQALGTDPAFGDTDRDGLDDFAEVRTALTNPLDADSDDDGVRDGAEGQICRNCNGDPTGDPDGDSTINALDPDSDDDGLFDGTELGVRNPVDGATDVAAGFFVADADPDSTTNPVVADTDGDLLLDGAEDANHNGRVDDGESDPNDPTDPGIPCTAGGSECPQNLSCGPDGVCVPGSGDGGAVCTPLDPALECCMGGCAGGTKVDPICRSNGAMESCPIGASQCRAGSCEGPQMPRPSEGCGCTAASETPGASWGLLLVLLLCWRPRSPRRAGATVSGSPPGFAGEASEVSCAPCVEHRVSWVVTAFRDRDRIRDRDRRTCGCHQTSSVAKRPL